jgi:hypothetical protein
LDRVRAASELERDRILLREAKRFIRDNPGRFLGLTLARLRFFWFGPPKERTSAFRKIADIAFAVYSFLLIVLALGSLAVRRDRVVGLFLLLILNFTLLYGLVQAGYYYYRMDIEPFCLILALITIEALWKRCREPIEDRKTLAN